jgi:hypothetical protein
MKNNYSQFDRQSLKDLRSDVSEALKVLEKAGIISTPGSISFSPSEASMKITFKCTNTKIDHVKEFNDNQVFFKHNVNPEAMNSSFTEMGVEYKVIGVNTKRPKYAFQVQRKDGKVFGFATSGLRAKFGPYKK